MLDITNGFCRLGTFGELINADLMIDGMPSSMSMWEGGGEICSRLVINVVGGVRACYVDSSFMRVL
jgi:hypothetical protein